MRTIAIAVVAAFAVTAVVLVTRTAPPRPAGASAQGAGTASPPLRGRALAEARAAVRAQPRRADGYTLLAAAELDQVRATGDPRSYARAEAAVRRALELRPGDQAALTERAALALSRHEFGTALRDARAAHAADPTVLRPYGALVDAQVELGRYADAGRALQEMIDRKPDLAGLTRVSYLRELRGDRAGALAALDAAQSAGGPTPESGAFVATLRGGLHLQRGDLRAARRAYREALHRLPRYAAAEAGLAKVEAATGHGRAAVRRLRRVVDRLPLPEHVTLLAETELATGRRRAAARDLALVAAERRLQRAAGVVVDTEAAVFAADHGDPRDAVRLGRRAWAAAPSVRSADALGWALTRAGRPVEGLRWAKQALRLGWRDPLARLHAGVAASRAGDVRHATPWLREALRGAAWLGPWQARPARAELARLERRAA